MDIQTLKSYSHEHWGFIAIPKSFITSSGESYLKQVKMYTYIYINSFKQGLFPIWEGTVADIVISLGYSSIKNCDELVKNIGLSIRELIEDGYIDIIGDLDYSLSGEFIKPREALRIVIKKSFSDVAANKDYLTLTGLELFTILNYAKLMPATPVAPAPAAAYTKSGAKIKILKLLIVYLVIKERVLRRPERYASISRDDICRLADVSRNTAKAAIDVLRDIRLIEYRKIGGVKKGDDSFFNQSTVYVIAGEDESETLNRLSHAVDSCYNNSRHNNDKNLPEAGITPYYIKDDDGIILDPMIGCE